MRGVSMGELTARDEDIIHASVVFLDLQNDEVTLLWKNKRSINIGKLP